MSNPSSLGDRFVAWALAEPAVSVVVQIGSRVRASGEPGSADLFSDWDFQIVVSRPDVFGARGDFVKMGIGAPLAHVVRGGRLGSARKVTALFPDGELDVVLIPAEQVGYVQQQVKAGTYAANPQVLRALEDQALVLAGGYKFIKGEALAGELFAFIKERVALPRLGDAEVCDLAEGFVCDYVSTLRKIDRGELLAAQRWLHHQLVEANFRLLHELRQRRSQPSFPDARRIETLSGPEQRALVAIDARPVRAELLGAVDKAAQNCRDLVAALVGEKWRWPELPIPVSSK